MANQISLVWLVSVGAYVLPLLWPEVNTARAENGLWGKVLIDAKQYREDEKRVCRRRRLPDEPVAKSGYYNTGIIAVNQYCLVIYYSDNTNYGY